MIVNHRTWAVLLHSLGKIYAFSVLKLYRRRYSLLPQQVSLSYTSTDIRKLGRKCQTFKILFFRYSAFYHPAIITRLSFFPL